MKVYEAVWEDLSHLGGPMGTEYTVENSLGLFATSSAAKDACQKHYGKKRLEWFDKGGKGYRTGDLLWVMYHVRLKEVRK